MVWLAFLRAIPSVILITILYTNSIHVLIQQERLLHTFLAISMLPVVMLIAVQENAHACCLNFNPRHFTSD